MSNQTPMSKDLGESSTSNKWICDECGLFFTADKNLVQHRKDVHLGIKSKQCDQCGVVIS